MLTSPFKSSVESGFDNLNNLVYICCESGGSLDSWLITLTNVGFRAPRAPPPTFSISIIQDILLG